MTHVPTCSTHLAATLFIRILVLSTAVLSSPLITPLQAKGGNFTEGEKLFALHLKRIFVDKCVACHGADGTGNTAFGAPNLTDAVWLYGGSREAIRASIADGRQG
ncbi:MAG: c-type cytochrome, partial [Rubripirellula sp.]